MLPADGTASGKDSRRGVRASRRQLLGRVASAGVLQFVRDVRAQNWAKTGFAVVATASFTFGPLLEIRAGLDRAGPFAEDGWVVAWFTVLQVVVLLLLLRGPRPAVSRTGCIALIGLGLLLILSTLWAFDSKTSLMQGVQLLATPFFGLYLWSRPELASGE